MISSRVKQLMESIRSKQFQSSSYIKAEPTQAEAILKIKALQQSYDHLLNESLTILQLLDETICQTSQQYDMLSEELERERKDHKMEADELEKNISSSDNKLSELRRIISDKEGEIFALKSELEEKESQINQFQVEARESLKKVIDEHVLKLSSEFQLQKSQLSREFTEITKKLKLQNEAYLQENEILSIRLEQMMKHIQQNQHQESVNYGIEPTIINHNPQSTNKKFVSPSSPSIYSISRQSSPQKSSEFEAKIEENSSESCGSNRMVLRQILNTEDRNSDNFGSINFYSKDRQYLTASNDENNCNRINTQIKTQEKPKVDQPMQIIQEFKADETHVCPDPYHIFFTLISQCAKIDSHNMEAAALLDLSKEWTYLTTKKIPLHEWYPTLVAKISSEICYV